MGFRVLGFRVYGFGVAKSPKVVCRFQKHGWTLKNLASQANAFGFWGCRGISGLRVEVGFRNLGVQGRVRVSLVPKEMIAVFACDVEV